MKKILYIILILVFSIMIVVFSAQNRNNEYSKQEEEIINNKVETESLKEKYNIDRELDNLNIEEMTTEEVMYLEELNRLEKVNEDIVEK